MGQKQTLKVKMPKIIDAQIVNNAKSELALVARSVVAETAEKIDAAKVMLAWSAAVAKESFAYFGIIAQQATRRTEAKKKLNETARAQDED
jgi:hypothetical protein